MKARLGNPKARRRTWQNRKKIRASKKSELGKQACISLQLMKRIHGLWIVVFTLAKHRHKEFFGQAWCQRHPENGKENGQKQT
eukprot:2558437-Pleurochrysis_carterae.AAC.1